MMQWLINKDIIELLRHIAYSCGTVDNVFFHCYHVAYKHKTNPYEVQNENQIIVPLQPGQELGAGNFLSLWLVGWNQSFTLIGW